MILNYFYLYRYNRDRGNSDYGRSNVSKHRSESSSRTGVASGSSFRSSSNSKPSMERRTGSSVGSMNGK